MTDTIEKKCSKDGWCTAMDVALNPEANAHKKGLSTFVVTRLTDGATRLAGVAYRTTAHDNGLLLNVCPWCTTPIDWSKDQADYDKEIT